MPSYMFDTNIFNRILDGVVKIGRFRGKAHFYATHVQLDEIKATSNVNRRQELLAVFEEISETNNVPTASFVLDVSRLDEGGLGNGNLYSNIKTELDKRNKGKPNNVQDGLIAETATKNALTLVTHDSDLYFVATKFNTACANLHQVMLELNRPIATTMPSSGHAKRRCTT